MFPLWKNINELRRLTSLHHVNFSFEYNTPKKVPVKRIFWSIFCQDKLLLFNISIANCVARSLLCRLSLLISNFATSVILFIYYLLKRSRKCRERCVTLGNSRLIGFNFFHVIWKEIDGDTTKVFKSKGKLIL